MLRSAPSPPSSSVAFCRPAIGFRARQMVFRWECEMGGCVGLSAKIGTAFKCNYLLLLL